MATRRSRTSHAHALPAEAVRQRAEHRRSGAAGVHADQKAKKSGALSRNRQGSRAARVRAAVADFA